MIAGELKTLWQLLRGVPRTGTHAERLQGFYAPQAAHYDRFRERLLEGRAELVEQLMIKAGERVVELGAGTGRNAEYYRAQIPNLAGVELVDLCPALLAQARRRVIQWANVAVIEADATHYRPSGEVDHVYFSYALTMIPDWSTAIDNALAMLRPGGTLGVVDFYHSQTQPAPGMAQHGGWSRHFWPWWFRHDGVRLSAAHLPYLQERVQQRYLREGLAPVPYLPGLRVPYYVLVGTKS